MKIDPVNEGNQFDVWPDMGQLHDLLICKTLANVNMEKKQRKVVVKVSPRHKQRIRANLQVLRSLVKVYESFLKSSNVCCTPTKLCGSYNNVRGFQCFY